jgi:serine protease
VLIVASAGNDGGPVDSPANCPGVLAVGGLRHAGTKVGYSNLGPEVALGAPAGNCVLTGANDPCLFSLDTTTDSGTQGPVSSTYTNSVNSNVGTSFSAPLAAATAGLMRALNPRLTPSQLIARLRSSAAAFPTTSDSTPAPPVCHTPAAKTDVQDAECLCTTAVCGAGLLNAGAALIEAQRPAAVAGVSGSVGTGRPLTLDGSGSGAAQGRSIASYTWSVVSTAGGASTPAFSNPNVATTTVLSPTSGSYTLRLTVTDSAGTSDSAELSVTAATSGGTTTSTAAPPASGSGGGGALSLELLALAALVTQRRRWQRGSHPARA